MHHDGPRPRQFSVVVRVFRPRWPPILACVKRGRGTGGTSGRQIRAVPREVARKRKETALSGVPPLYTRTDVSPRNREERKGNFFAHQNLGRCDSSEGGASPRRVPSKRIMPSISSKNYTD